MKGRRICVGVHENPLLIRARQSEPSKGVVYMGLEAQRANGDMMGMARHAGQCYVEGDSNLIWELKIRHGYLGDGQE